MYYLIKSWLSKFRIWKRGVRKISVSIVLNAYWADHLSRTVNCLLFRRISGKCKGAITSFWVLSLSTLLVLRKGRLYMAIFVRYIQHKSFFDLCRCCVAFWTFLKILPKLKNKPFSSEFYKEEGSHFYSRELLYWKRQLKTAFRQVFWVFQIIIWCFFKGKSA